MAKFIPETGKIICGEDTPAGSVLARRAYKTTLVHGALDNADVWGRAAVPVIDVSLPYT